MKKFIAATLATLVVGGFVAPAAFAGETVGQKVDDAAVVAKIKAELLKSPDVSGLAVNVDAKNGVVTLVGQCQDRRPSAPRLRTLPSTPMAWPRWTTRS